MTYSVVARCPDTGQVGVATQSHWFAVGTLVSWCRGNAGAVATQAVTDVSYGPLALDLMTSGHSAGRALHALLANDEHSDLRQIIIVDTSGDTAIHSGRRCVPHAEQAQRVGAAFAANLMTTAGVPSAMAAAWDATTGQTLARRILATLDAAQAAGGDLRGQQSAALRVNSPVDGEWWKVVNIDLRVDDHREPLAELRRLLGLREAYTEVEFAAAADAKGRLHEASLLHEVAGTALPESPELAFWRAVGHLRLGNLDLAAERLQPLVGTDPRWGELLIRLHRCGQLDGDQQVIARLAKRQSDR